MSWDDYHGEEVDLRHKYYEPREITLSCFVKAENKADFIEKNVGFRLAIYEAWIVSASDLCG